MDFWIFCNSMPIIIERKRRKVQHRNARATNAKKHAFLRASAFSSLARCLPCCARQIPKSSYTSRWILSKTNRSFKTVQNMLVCNERYVFCPCAISIHLFTETVNREAVGLSAIRLSILNRNPSIMNGKIYLQIATENFAKRQKSANAFLDIFKFP